MFHKKEDQQPKVLSENQEVGTIGRLDFGIWTLISAIGIIFCLIHSEQEKLWTWSGDTAEEAQSLKAKVTVSVMSTIIGGCVVALLTKTIACVSFTIIKYKGAHFSQLVTLIGGHTPSNIPMLIAGRGWFSISMILFVLAASAVTKQLAQVSMGVTQNWVDVTGSFNTRNYTTCINPSDTPTLQRVRNSFSLEAINSIRNPNISYTSELYDKSIPAGLKGETTFNRELPFANVSCEIVPKESDFSYLSPMVDSSNDNKLLGDLSRAWSSIITLTLNDRNPDKSVEWVNCTISIGHATAYTSCNDTSCTSQRISEITPYTKYINSSDVGVGGLLLEMFRITTPTASASRNGLLVWLLGGDITYVYNRLDLGVPGESLAVIRDRAELLATVVGRILCDYNGDMPYSEVTTFDSSYKDYGKYVYRVLWKWPFWLLAGSIFICWAICLGSMRMTPENRIMSVDWLLSQYIERNRWSYLSGSDLVKAHKGSIFRVIDKNPEGDIGYITISSIDVLSDSRNDRVLQGRLYM
ncbi:hypothetical protein BDF21DRAFT_403312 [Thamnidium elegans]|nr:hypothetical protein BDF21DRAFT_403312 [Thamnidium elegans]